ncbi:MAG: T9SS type A sorting domain-containing protein [Bacteroidia bacterium]|nr:T9SS type A sorting domain-containing protein [Bacteroidia bacterium]
MIRSFVKYLCALGVVFFGFQIAAFADEGKDKKDEKSSSSSTTRPDTIVVSKLGDITVGDTLVFDDFDEDESEDDKGESGSIALVVTHDNPEVYPSPRSVTAPAKGSLPLKRAYQTSVSDSEELPVSEPMPVELSEALEVRLYPNPAAQGSEPVFIEHNQNGVVQIHILAINGQTTRSITTTDKVTTVSDLSSGLYIVTIIGDQQRESRKLLVQ